MRPSGGPAAPLLAALAFTALTAGCAFGPPPLRATRLELEETGHGLQPWVPAVVAGQPLRLLLDTGAVQSILPATFARENGLACRGEGYNSTLVDATGHHTAMIQLANVPVRFEGTPAAAPLDFLQNPVAGATPILAPHELLRRGWAMRIDLGRGELRFEPEEEARRHPSRLGAWREVEYRGCLSNGPFMRAHRIVEVKINGVLAEMLLDTGATTTTLARNNPAIPSMLGRSGDQSQFQAVASSGGGLILAGVPVSLPGFTTEVPVLVSASSQQCWDGAIGTDLLRHCEILWGWSGLWMACGPPGAAAAP